MTRQAVGAAAIDDRLGWLRKIGAVAALTTGALLLVGLIALLWSIAQPAAAGGWLSAIGDNWLVKIFLLHADLPQLHADLYGLNVLDVVLLVLVSILCFSLGTCFRGSRRVWSLIAFGLSVIAIALFIATQLAGRSTVMLAVLINSVVMLTDRAWGRATAYTGILASVLLFAGDLTVGVHSSAITVLFGVGYVLLTAWLFLMARALKA